jgi:ribosomal protein S18 acetylase RimI-like enzyme
MYGTKTVALKPISGTETARQKKIIGSVECSQHEFYQTILGNSRPKNSLLYVTEVAVCPEARRCGTGLMLMKGVDKVAELRNVESIYLHVDVTNQAACAMYQKAGYRIIDKREHMYAQFTASLNLHDGALMGRCHYLMCKDMPAKATRTEEKRLSADLIEEHLAWLHG